MGFFVTRGRDGVSLPVRFLIVSRLFRTVVFGRLFNLTETYAYSVLVGCDNRLRTDETRRSWQHWPSAAD